MPGNDERDQFVRRRCDCHRVFHGGHATQDMFEFGGFDASPVDLQLAPFATDDPQQAKIVQLDEITRRENSNAWIVRIRLGGDDSAVLPMAEQNIRAFDQEFAALARLNGTSLSSTIANAIPGSSQPAGTEAPCSGRLRGKNHCEPVDSVEE